MKALRLALSIALGLVLIPVLLLAMLALAAAETGQLAARRIAALRRAAERPR